MRGRSEMKSQLAKALAEQLKKGIDAFFEDTNLAELSPTAQKGYYICRDIISDAIHDNIIPPGSK